jgi:hyperosmotically inducible periplasmic protein
MALFDYARSTGKLKPTLMKIILALLVGGLIGAAAVWFYQSNPNNRRLRDAGTQIETSAKSAGDALQDKLRSLNLRSEDIKEELARTGRVIRQKTEAAGQAISDAASDTRITSEIKAKLLRHPDLSAWDVSVSTTDGIVTLSGSVASPDLIGKAVLLAMEPDGVKQVVSTLQIKPKDLP